MLGRAIDLLFPRSCAGCGAGPWPFCGTCVDALEPLGPPWCRRCGRPVTAPVETCGDCPPPPVVSARAAFAYRGPARTAVHRLKFSGWRGVGDGLARSLAALGPPPADAVTWVPLAARRRAERGFDQARVLAEALARELDLPSGAYVRRVDSTGSQARRTRAERLEAMRGAFVPIPRRRPPTRLLLVDDVLTTGATAAACAAALERGGAGEIHLVTACRSFSDRPPARAARAARAAAGPPGSRSLEAPAYTRVCSRPGLWLPGEPPR